ncbi:MAG TPA: hypothetical protein VK020_09915, partial [Microlunatus sp.]|nr:hypothetical protein [Microlunatus sp.]
RRHADPGLENWEATNLLTVATVVVASARLREESRGAQWRDDFDGRADSWRGHLIGWLESFRDGSGPARLRHGFVPTGERE